MSADWPNPLPPVGTVLPAGVELQNLTAHSDSRGSLTEIFRRTWNRRMDPVQWNVVHSNAGVLRGIHLHPKHDDYLVALAGQILVGLRDLRPQSPTRGRGALVPLNGDEPAAILIPHGVAHGFLHLTASIHIYALTHYWNPDDDRVCRYDDPQLNLPWPIKEPMLSPQDREASGFATLLAEFGDSL